MRTETEIKHQIEIYYGIYVDYKKEGKDNTNTLIYFNCMKELIFCLGYSYEEADTILKNPLEVGKLLYKER